MFREYCVNECLVNSFILSLLIVVSLSLSAVSTSQAITFYRLQNPEQLGKCVFQTWLKINGSLASLAAWKVSTNLQYYKINSKLPKNELAFPSLSCKYLHEIIGRWRWVNWTSRTRGPWSRWANSTRRSWSRFSTYIFNATVLKKLNRFKIILQDYQTV